MVKQEIINNTHCTLYITENADLMSNIDKAVTISVSAYNSSKFILETLESATHQTYPHLILQVSDDNSTDNTIKVCKQWIEKNKNRFIKTKILIPDHNTGVSGNVNRAWDICETKYFKGIAGDDILLPNCIEENMKYVLERQDTVFLFSKIKCFGVDDEQNRKMEKQFDYSSFGKTPKEQLDCFLSFKNFVPASTAFVNIEKIRAANIRNDERIPMYEDLPKWINVLRAGIKLNFMDEYTVKYRISEGALSTSKIPSVNYIRNTELFWFYYIFDSEYFIDKDKAILKAVERYMNVYSALDKTYHSKGNILLRVWNALIAKCFKNE